MIRIYLFFSTALVVYHFFNYIIDSHMNIPALFMIIKV